jgi:hypothetical protein
MDRETLQGLLVQAGVKKLKSTAEGFACLTRRIFHCMLSFMETKICDVALRFWSKVVVPLPFIRRRVCWLWKGKLDKDGYGHFRIRRASPRPAHVVAWELYNGRGIGNKFGLHTCDIRHCVSPYHVYPGTHLDNMADRKRAGHYYTGADHHNSVLTWAQRAEIAGLLARRECTRVELAARYNVNDETVGRAAIAMGIRRGLTTVERDGIMLAISGGMSQKAVARMFKRDPATVRSVLGLR